MGLPTPRPGDVLRALEPEKIHVKKPPIAAPSPKSAKPPAGSQSVGLAVEDGESGAVAPPAARRPAGWPPTRYEAKALAAGRTPLYWSLRRARNDDER